MQRWMVYGANGYTGTLVAELASRRELTPILAGRSHAKVARLGERLGFETRTFDLADPAAVRAGLDGISAVLHCAGPFSATSRPMVDACIATGTHYLDVTGEIDVFEAIHGRDTEAKAASVALIPGVGFDVVPTDCLAAMVAGKLEAPTHLEGAFFGSGSSSQGTTKSMIEGLPMRGRARINGELVTVPGGWKVREVPFADKARNCVSIPWGDVSTAYYSTKIPNIIFYMAMPKRLASMVRRLDKVRWLTGRKTVQGLLKRLVDWKVEGPTDEQRARGFSQIWIEVRDATGAVATGTLRAPNGYSLTADASIKAVQRVLEGVEPGAHTPATAFGADFIRTLEGVEVFG